MAYLLNLMSPGLGHLASRCWVSGGLLLLLWLIGHSVIFVATSFNVWFFLGFPIFQVLLALIAGVHLYRIQRKNGAKHRTGYLRSFLILPIGLVVSALVAITVTQFLVRPVKIRSGSMTPSVVTGDVILVQLFAPIFWGVHLGDIVLVEHPTNARLLIKRIIGIAGDLITIRDGELHRNGRRLSSCQLRTLRDHETNQQVIERMELIEQRPYLVWDQPGVRSRALTVRVPANHLFVVGDNRDRSGDSRSFGTVPVSAVHGLVTTRVMPVWTNQIYQAPVGARRAAFQRCTRRTAHQPNSR